ncbi:unnamed protein product [Penicillium glandicola]
MALHIAATGGFDDIVVQLLASGASIRRWDMNKHDPIMCAERRNRASTAKLLQNARPEVTGDYDYRVAQGLWDRNALHSAAEAGDDLVNLEGPRRSAQESSLAVCSGSLKTVKQPLAAQSPIDLTDSLGQTLLHYAAEQSSLISAGAELPACDKWSRTSLHLAVEKNRPILVEALIKAGAKLHGDWMWNTPLHVAIEAGHDQVACFYWRAKVANQA